MNTRPLSRFFKGAISGRSVQPAGERDCVQFTKLERLALSLTVRAHQAALAMHLQPDNCACMVTTRQ